MDTAHKRMRGVFDRVLPDIRPTEEETRQTISNVNWVMERLRNIVPGNVEIRVTGSVSKDTNLRGNSDIDLFMLFPRDTPRDKLVKLGLSYGRRAMARGSGDTYSIKYAEHPYVQLLVKSRNIEVDIVPALKIDSIEELATSVDRTPLHTEFINSRLTDRQRDDVRLLKYFLMAHNAYGAEVKTGGFSGYLCELLIHYFGSLEKLLESAASFRLPVTVAPGKGHSNDRKLEKRFNHAFVVVDPVDRNRNVAAGASIESLIRFVLAARRFVGNPNVREFQGRKFSSERVHRQVNKLITDTGLRSFLVVMRVPDKSEDTIWPQLRRESGIITGHAARFGFGMHITAQWISNGKGFMLFLAPDERIKARMLKGPDAFMRTASDNFIRSHKGAFGFTIKGSTLYALETNAHDTMNDVMRSIIKGNYISRRKGINLRGARLFVNNIPKEYASDAYFEIMKKLSL